MEKLQNTMHFPDEIWELIMSHFHSMYKKPFHYDAIMAVSEFYFCNLQHRECHKYGLQWNRSLSVDSYYMRLVIYSNFNVSHSKKTSQTKLNRGVASSKICDDFINIFEVYKKNSLTNVLNNINYK